MGIASHIVRKEEGRPGLEPGRLGHNTSPGFLLSYPMPWQSYCEIILGPSSTACHYGVISTNDELVGLITLFVVCFGHRFLDFAILRVERRVAEM